MLGYEVIGAESVIFHLMTYDDNGDSSVVTECTSSISSISRALTNLAYHPLYDHYMVYIVVYRTRLKNITYSYARDSGLTYLPT